MKNDHLNTKVPTKVARLEEKWSRFLAARDQTLLEAIMNFQPLLKNKIW